MAGRLNSTKSPVFLRFRRDLHCSLQENNGKPFYLVEDPSSGNFYRVGVREWNLATYLDGCTTLPAAVGRLESEYDALAMSPLDAESAARRLLAMGLADIVGPDGKDPRKHPPPAARARHWGAPFFIRVPLFYPDRFLTAALPYSRWLTSWRFLIVGLAVIVTAVSCLAADWQRFTDSALVYLAPHTWAYLWLVWVLLKIVHEFFHGLFCKKYGGYVGAAGVALILFSPVAYTDVTSSWRFRSKWHRIFTSAAGIYAELLIAGIAAIVWSRFESGAVSQACHSIVLMASIMTILFNANPLMRFDGYYILSDLLEFQNLYAAGQQYVRGLLRSFFLGLPANSPSEQHRIRRGIVRSYGVATAIWRILVCLSLLLLASTLFHGAWLIVALLGVISWAALPICRFVKFLVVGQPGQKPNLARFAVTSVATGTFATGVLWLPWPGGVSAPAIVVYAPEEVVRTESSGFIEQVHVTTGQYVRENQLLVTLRNEELSAELADAVLATQRSVIRSRILLQQDGDLAKYQAELDELYTFQKRQSRLQSLVDGLVVRAPIDGYVLGRWRENLVGQFKQIGAPLMVIAHESQKEIQVSIPEAYIDVFSQNVGIVPHVRVPGRNGKVLAGPLTKVEPRASTDLQCAALGGNHGGPLAVREVRQADRERTVDGFSFQLVAPHFRGVISLPAEESMRLRAGQLAKVRIYDTEETLGRCTYRAMKSWIQRKLNQRTTAET